MLSAILFAMCTYVASVKLVVFTSTLRLGAMDLLVLGVMIGSVIDKKRC